MNDANIGTADADQTGEDGFVYEVSDEALEIAAGMGGDLSRGSWNWFPPQPC